MPEPMVPNTRVTRIALIFIMLVVPVVLYKSFYLLTGRTIDYGSRPVEVLTALGLLGMVIGFLLLSFEVFRSARRE